jgi:hypothetical protein
LPIINASDCENPLDRRSSKPVKRMLQEFTPSIIYEGADVERLEHRKSNKSEVSQASHLILINLGLAKHAILPLACK